MFETIGNVSVHVALVTAVYALGASLLGGVYNSGPVVKSGRNALALMIAWVTLATVMLWACLLTGRFHLQYVYQYSGSNMPTFYKWAALWGGQAGSLLFWAFVLCIYAGFFLWSQRKKNSELLPYIVATLAFVAGFFLILIVFVANPFDTLPFPVRDGVGLNPLLQNFYMIIHPPSLYLGYVGMTVPFGFAMAALATGRVGNTWLKEVRMWTLVTWFFLSVGNLLGASWAYEVLGWGGYWGWDPVENAALIPWFTVTAFLHSAIITEKRQMLKVWTMVLAILSFLLTILGTFLTRSGIVSSVHSFAKSDIGHYFLTFLGLTVVVSVVLIAYRWRELRSKAELDSFISREAVFLLNNLVFVGMAVAVLWGTLFPVFSELVRGEKITFGPEYFNSFMVPIGLVLLLLTGLAPLVAWRKTQWSQLRQYFVVPVLVVVATSVLLIWLAPHTGYWLHNVYVNVSLSLCVFVITTIVMEYARGMGVRQVGRQESWRQAGWRLFFSNRRRYGGYLIHLSIVIMFIGFTGDAYKVEKELTLKRGESDVVGPYTIRYNDLVPSQDQFKEIVTARLAVWRNSEPYTVATPARLFYKTAYASEEDQSGTKIAIHRSIKQDLYLALLGYDRDGTVYIGAMINPLVQFIWIGGIILVLGGLLIMMPLRETS